MEAIKNREIITDKLVVEKTNKTIETWFKLLDKKGAATMTHTEIFNLVNSVKGLKPLGEWNHNLLTTTYEWRRGLKERGQKKGGFEINVSKTIETTVSEAYKAWTEENSRTAWLGQENIIIRKSTENKSARISWSDGTTSLSIDFYSKGENRSQVVVQHLKIPDAIRAAEMKIFWSEKLRDLKIFLEK